jgi:hypothetical protein
MAMKRTFCPTRRQLVALLASSVAGCGEDGATSTSTTGSASSGAGAEDLSDVIYEGGATDEALVALVARSASFNEAEGTRFLEPADGANLPPATPALFAWAVGTVARRAPGLLERGVGLVLGVREARAHGTPISGRAYFVVFHTPSQPKLLRVFTTALTYTPDGAAWERLAAAGEPITVDIVNAIFEDNRVADGGGPHLGVPLHVTVGS